MPNYLLNKNEINYLLYNLLSGKKEQKIINRYKKAFVKSVWEEIILDINSCMKIIFFIIRYEILNSL